MRLDDTAFRKSRNRYSAERKRKRRRRFLLLLKEYTEHADKYSFQPIRKELREKRRSLLREAGQLKLYNPEKALKPIQEAEEILFNSRLLKLKCECLDALGRGDEMLAEAKRAYGMASQFETNLLMARAHFCKRNFQTALNYILEAHKFTQNEESVFVHAETLRKLTRWSESLRVIEAASRSGMFIGGHLLLCRAYCYKNLWQFNEAFQAFVQAEKKIFKWRRPGKRGVTVRLFVGYVFLFDTLIVGGKRKKRFSFFPELESRIKRAVKFFWELDPSKVGMYLKKDYDLVMNIIKDKLWKRYAAEMN